MEEKKLTIQDASQFVRDLIEIGGVYKVDSTDFIVNTVDGAPATLEIKGQPKPIMIWSEKAKLGDHVLLNIFGETVNTTEERNWFYTFLSMVPGHVLKNMMTAIINAALAKDQNGKYEAIEMISPFVKDIDDKTKNELNLLTARDIAVIVYHKPSKTAQLQTKLFDESFRQGIGKKIRTKTWKLFDAMFKALMSIPDEETMSKDFKISANILGMKQTDAMVRVIVKFAENVEQYARVLLGQEYKLGNLIEGCKNLEIFFGIMRVFTSGGGRQIDKGAPATSPFGKSNSVPLQTGGSAAKVISLGGSLPIVLPDVVGKDPKKIELDKPKMALPDVVHPGRFGAPVPAAPAPMYRQPYMPIFGKPVAIDNAAQMRSQGPKIIPIMDNGKVVR